MLLQDVAFDIRDDMHDVAVAFYGKAFCDAHGSGL